MTALFSGQGSQYVNMFKDVAENWPQFRTQVTMVDTAGVKACGRKASSVLYPRKEYDQEPEKDKTIINSTLNAQPTTLGCELGVYSIFTDAGFKPEFVAGHSLGELAALVAGGCISNEDAAELVWHRAIAMSTGGAENIVGEDVEMKTSSKGGMAAVLGKGAANIEPITPNVYVANRNAPQQLVISGESSAVLQESNRLSSQGFKVVQLKVGDAFHTPFMKDAETTFSTKVRSVGLRQPTAGVTVYSNVTGKPYPDDNSRAVNLLATQMTSAVQFVKQVENMYNDGARVFVEFGPRKTLTKLVGQILEGRPDVVTIAVNPGKPGDNSDLLMREAAAQMAVAGVTLDQFDPWGTPNPFRKKSQVKKKRKTSLRLSAATYVSKRTKKMQQKIIDEPYTLKISNGRVSSQPSEADKAKLRQKTQNCATCATSWRMLNAKSKT